MTIALRTKDAERVPSFAIARTHTEPNPPEGTRFTSKELAVRNPEIEVSAGILVNAVPAAVGSPVVYSRSERANSEEAAIVSTLIARRLETSEESHEPTAIVRSASFPFNTAALYLELNVALSRICETKLPSSFSILPPASDHAASTKVPPSTKPGRVESVRASVFTESVTA